MPIGIPTYLDLTIHVLLNLLGVLLGMLYVASYLPQPGFETKTLKIVAQRLTRRATLLPLYISKTYIDSQNLFQIIFVKMLPIY